MIPVSLKIVYPYLHWFTSLPSFSQINGDSMDGCPDFQTPIRAIRAAPTCPAGHMTDAAPSRTGSARWATPSQPAAWRSGRKSLMFCPVSKRHKKKWIMMYCKWIVSQFFSIASDICSLAMLFFGPFINDV